MSTIFARKSCAISILTLFLPVFAINLQSFAGGADEPPPNVEAASVEIGHPLHDLELKVPKELGKKNLMVILGGTLSAEGSFEDISVWGGDSAFSSAVLDAVHQWRYSPPSYRKGVCHHRGQTRKISSSVAPDLPVPTAPREPLEMQTSSAHLFRAGGAVTYPKALYSPSPEYSEVGEERNTRVRWCSAQLLDRTGTYGTFGQ
jgi:hypothetical protein